MALADRSNLAANMLIVVTALAISLSSASVITNALRLRALDLQAK